MATTRLDRRRHCAGVAGDRFATTLVNRKGHSIALCERLRALMEGPPMTFVFHHGGKFKTNESGYLCYEPDNTEVLMGVEANTLDVFFVKGYYKELGYAEMNNCLWKVPGTLLDNGLRRLENDADLLALVKDYRRNHHFINIYFEHVVSKPHVVDCMSEDGDDVLQLPTIPELVEKINKDHNDAIQKEPKLSTPSYPHLSPLLSPHLSPHLKPHLSQLLSPLLSPHLSPLFNPPLNPHAAKISSKATTADKINKKVKATTSTRSGRQVKATPVDNDSDSHDSYESAEDSLYKPPKVAGDSIYSNDSDSGVDGVESSRTKKVDHREKHRPAADRTRDKAIDTDDSSYEDIESDECSDGESDEEFLYEESSDGDEWKGKPILSLAEEVRRMVMKSISDNRLKLLTYQGILTPVQQSRLESLIKLSRNWAPYWSGDAKEEVYKVQGWPTNMVVDLGNHTFSCRFWQLTG
ncbi:hypothetical protein Ahy_B05g075307 [Arachis hypogaea]|uniref:PB1-like domain-containing protein n=1 Tax=Arachis hypogaea TaxID=3818 RepID=A0A444Z0Z0_ARAHY|nr:hypothetical protein Ahy_B05g075307 [Arachis hypogaea]